mgnify:CR=1 FL=1
MSKHFEYINEKAVKAGVRIRTAVPNDARRIQTLYAEIYGADYSVPLVTDRESLVKLISGDNSYWLVADHNGRIVGSLAFEIDRACRAAKLFGAVVSREYRELELAHTMIKIILDDIIRDKDEVDVVYATARTASKAPQKITSDLGFVKLGIFPNTHKVRDSETHCLVALFGRNAMEKRKSIPKIIPEVKPFFDLVAEQMPLGACWTEDVTGTYSDPQTKIPLMDFEVITAPSFVKHSYGKCRAGGVFEHVLSPFQQPNMMLITPDMKNTVYIYYNKQDRYSVILGGAAEEKNAAVLLESTAHKLKELGLSYVEILVDAYEPRLQREAVDARFIPSAYFPCIKFNAGERMDGIVFSKTFEILDFRNVDILPVFKDFLRAYLALWQENYINIAFRK